MSFIERQHERLTSGTGYSFAVADPGTDHAVGLRVAADPNVPVTVGTLNEDVSIVYRAADLLLFEGGDGAPRQFRFEQTLDAS